MTTASSSSLFFCFILQLGDTLNRQFESVCETMFGEVESQAVEALDLPGVFRTRSHSYVRAIQAGCSQDDDCLSVFSMSGPQGSIKGGAGECVRACGSVLCNGRRMCVCLFTRRQLGGRHSRAAGGGEEDLWQLVTAYLDKSEFIHRHTNTKGPRSRSEAACNEQIKF